MIARGFIENLANRTAAVGSHPTIAIRPAISPDMIPDAFSAAEDIAPIIPPSPKIESVARPPEASMPAQSPDNNSKVSPMIKDVKPQKRSQSRDVSESKDVPRAAFIDGKPSVSPAAPADVHAEPSPQKPLAEKEGGGDKEIMIQDEEAKPPIRPAVTYKTPEQSRPALDNSKEISPRQHGKEDDNNNAVSPGSAIEARGSTRQPGAEMAKGEKEEDAAVAPTVIIIRPEANQMTKEADHAITTPHHDKPDLVQQGSPGAHPAMQAQSQAGHVQDNTVTINIGRIEVRAVFPQKQGPAPAKEQTGVSLSQYLKMRSEGKI